MTTTRGVIVSVVVALFMGLQAYGQDTQPAAAPAEAAAEATADIPAEKPELSSGGGITLGARGGEDEFFTHGDILAPIWWSEQGMLFFNPRFSANDGSEQELNLGFGYRHLFNALDADMIVGGNVYYDHRWSAYDNRFDQIGVGLEFLTEWFDARANLYEADDDEELAATLRETSSQTASATWTEWSDLVAQGHAILQEGQVITETTVTTLQQLFNQFETAMDGFDAEVGVKLPYLDEWVETRMFVGYQDFDNPYGKDFGGIKARVEMKPLPGLILDGEYFEDDVLNGTDYLLGARVRVPFDISRIADGKNPFEGAGEEFKRGERDFSQRLTEEVIRDMNIRLNLSPWIEDLAARKETVDRHVESKEVTDILLDDVNFVRGAGTRGPADEDGTAANPYGLIQEAIDNVFGQNNVYVFAAGQPYEENVLIDRNVNVYGQGHKIVGNGGRSFGGDEAPVVVNAIPLLPTFTIVGSPILGADDVSIQGFDIRNSGGGVPGLAAVAAINVENFQFNDNIVRESLVGVASINAFMPDFEQSIFDNEIFNVGVGVAALSINSPGGLVEVMDNHIYNAPLGVLGAALDLSGSPAGLDLVVAGNTIEGGGTATLLTALDGLLGGLPAIPPIDMPGSLPDLVLTWPPIPGGLPADLPSVGAVTVAAVGDAHVTAQITDNAISDHLLGITAVGLGPDSEMDLAINDNLIVGGASGALLDLGFSMANYPYNLLGMTAIADVDQSLAGITVAALYGSEIDAEIMGNELYYNLLGINVLGMGDDTEIDLEIGENWIMGGNPAPATTLDVTIPNVGLAGITVLGIDNAEIRNAQIYGNVIDPHVIGIAYLGFEGADMRWSEIEDNVLLDNWIGVGVAAVGPGTTMQGLDVTGNDIYGNGLGELGDFLSDISPLVNIFDPTLGTVFSYMDRLPDTGVAGIAVVGTDGADLSDLDVDDNYVASHLVGIGLVGFYGADMSGADIDGNTVENSLVGIAAAAFDGADMGDMDIFHNDVYADLLGIGLVGLNSGTQFEDVDVAENRVYDALIGIGAVGFGGVNMDGLDIWINEVSGSEIGIGVLSIGPGTSIDDLWIENNDVMDGTIGIGVLGMAGASIERAYIGNNGVSDARIGIVMAGLSGALMDDFSINGNGIWDVELAVLTVASGTAQMNDGSISHNWIDDVEIGILPLAIGAVQGGLEINYNDIYDAGVGIMPVAINGGALVSPTVNFNWMENTGMGVLSLAVNGGIIGAPEYLYNDMYDAGLGIGLVAGQGSSIISPDVGYNLVDTSTIGIAALALGSGASISNPLIGGNIVIGGVPDTSSLPFSIPLSVPTAPGLESGLAGIVVLARDGGLMANPVIGMNTVENDLLGIGAVALDGGIMPGVNIVANTLDGNVIGVLALAMNPTTIFTADIHDNDITGAGSSLLSDLTGLALPEMGLAGVLVGAINTGAGPAVNIDVHDNLFENNIAAVLGLSAGNLTDALIGIHDNETLFSGGYWMVGSSYIATDFSGNVMDIFGFDVPVPVVQIP